MDYICDFINFVGDGIVDRVYVGRHHSRAAGGRHRCNPDPGDSRAKTGVTMDENKLTIGFARRASTYKRGDLLFRDVERLKRISGPVGKIQIIFAGKAHP